MFPNSKEFLGLGVDELSTGATLVHMSEEYPKPTEFPKEATKFGKTNSDSVVAEAWFDTVPGRMPYLWLRAKDGDLVCVPAPNHLGILKKLLRRGRNP